MDYTVRRAHEDLRDSLIEYNGISTKAFLGESSKFTIRNIDLCFELKAAPFIPFHAILKKYDKGSINDISIMTIRYIVIDSNNTIEYKTTAKGIKEIIKHMSSLSVKANAILNSVIIDGKKYYIGWNMLLDENFETIFMLARPTISIFDVNQEGMWVVNRLAIKHSNPVIKNIVKKIMNTGDEYFVVNEYSRKKRIRVNAFQELQEKGEFKSLVIDSIKTYLKRIQEDIEL